MRYKLKTERRIELSQHEILWVQIIIGYLCIHPTFPYRIKCEEVADFDGRRKNG
jgi:hypothetical protein